MERDLVVSAQHGDQAAFVDLIRSRVDRLYAVAQRVLRDVDRAEDALQDALVIAWRDLRGLRDPDRFDAWLHRLVVRECIDQATRERRRTANLRLLPIDGPAAPDELLTLTDRDQLERGFRRLSPEQRAILVLHHFLGYAPSATSSDCWTPGSATDRPKPPIASSTRSRTRSAASPSGLRGASIGGTST